ncbi:MAG: hypothetical protein KDA63_16160 [Planctomycetales bacterium]|nr:hypothetical protein [Planctomycetales bacterium]
MSAVAMGALALLAQATTSAARDPLKPSNGYHSSTTSSGTRNQYHPSSPGGHAGVDVTPRASSSKHTEREAIAALPLDRLTPQQRAKVESVTARTTVFRRMPAQVVRCDPEMYLFLVEHPEVLANIWGLAAEQQGPTGIQEIALTRTGPDTLTAHDGLGTEGNVEILYRSHDKHLLYASGSYDGPLFLKPVEGAGLLYLTTVYSRDPNGAYYITCQLDTFIALERSGTELLARTFSPIVGKVADASFVQSLAFVQMLSDVCELNPAGIGRLTPRLDHVDPDVCNEFSRLALKAATRAEQRRMSARVPEAVTAQPLRPTAADLRATR